MFLIFSEFSERNSNMGSSSTPSLTPSLSPVLPFHPAPSRSPPNIQAETLSVNADEVDASKKEGGRKRPRAQQEALNEEWERRKKIRERSLGLSSEGNPETFTPSATAQKLIGEVWRIKDKKNNKKMDHFTVAVKKIDEGKISLEGDDLLSVISELGQAIDWLEEVEDKALAFDMLAGIVGKIPANYRLRGIEILGERLFFIYNACYPETGLDENASDDDDEDSPHAQRLVGSLDRLIDMVENLEEDNDVQARAGILVAAMLILPARGTGNIERFIRMAEIFKRMEDGDLKVQGINTLMDQIDSINVEDDDLFEQVLKDLDRAAKSIGSVIETINDPADREKIGKEIRLQFKASKKAWELINETRRKITEEITPGDRMVQFTGIVRKVEDKTIPLHGKNLLSVVSELRDAIKSLSGQHKAAAFHMLAKIVEDMLSGTARERGVEILTQCLLSINSVLLRERPWANSPDRLIDIVENFGEEDNDAQARASSAVISTLGFPVPGKGNAERFSRMAGIFKNMRGDSLKEQGITALVDQIGSIIVDGDELFAEFLDDLDSVAGSIGSIIATIEDEDVRERVDEEVTSRLKALKKVWELTNAARQITGKELPGESMAQFAGIVKKLKDKEIPLLGEDRFNVISELGDAVERLDGIQHKAAAFYMLSEIVGNMQGGTNRARGVGVLAQILQGIIDKYCRLEDGTDNREFVAVLLDKLIDFVDGLKEDNDAQARAGIAVLRKVNWPAGTRGGVERLVRMAGIFEHTKNQDLKVQGLEALTVQIGSVIDGDEEDSYEGGRSALELVEDSLNQIVDTITDEEEEQDAREMVDQGLNDVLERR